MSIAELQQIELNIQQGKVITALGESLERLLDNRDFKKLISVGYFEQEAIRLVHLKADPNMQGDNQQKSILSQMNAIGSLKQYLLTIETRANMASKAIEADEQMLADLLAEGDQA